ncbi:MAG: hypothetical protein JWM98_1297 [Thermoleophilia bacterium]|nr:hypothetical protein [Thermoleophilia bacterium]
MAGNGSVGTAGAGLATTFAAARLAAAQACCHEPVALRPAPTPPQAPGGAAAHHAGHHHRPHHPHHPPAGQVHVATTCLPAGMVRGGGPAAPAVLVDPALSALGTLLADAAPLDRPPSPLRGLATAIRDGLARLVLLLPARGEAPDLAPALGAAPTLPDAPVPLPQLVPLPMPLQPAPPPSLTFDPELGTIVGIGDGEVPAPHDGLDDPAPGSFADRFRIPSSWVAIAGMFSRPALASRGRDLVARIDDLLDEVGITRLQLLLLTLLAPIATAFAIKVVVDLLG